MSLFSEDFYTDDFDQEMLDWIKSNLKISQIQGEWDVSHTKLEYYNTKGIDYFWTSNCTSHETKLTKQQFKEKIGMVTKQFTIADLKDGMVVEIDSGLPDHPNKRVIFNGGIYLGNYAVKKDMEYIVPVDDLFDSNGLLKKGILCFKYMGETIWQREPEQCPKQKQLDELYKQIDELKAKADMIKGG